jgi:hypothetical protein
MCNTVCIEYKLHKDTYIEAYMAAVGLQVGCLPRYIQSSYQNNNYAKSTKYTVHLFVLLFCLITFNTYTRNNRNLVWKPDTCLWRERERYTQSKKTNLILFVSIHAFVAKRDEVTGGWRKLHNEELHGLYYSPSIVRVIKARRMRWTGHVARMGEVRGAYNILVGRPEGRNH